jgi:hypothetical protein
VCCSDSKDVFVELTGLATRDAVIHVDPFLKPSEVPGPLARRIVDLDRCIKARGNRPLIVEGVFLLETLNEVGRSPDFLIFVEEECASSIPRTKQR